MAVDIFTPLISSVVAAIAIMLSSELIEHNLEFKHAIFLALAANIATFFATPFVAPMLTSYIPYVVLTSDMTTTTLLVDLALWIILAFVIMTDSLTEEKIKIALYGFVVTTIVMLILPYILPVLGPINFSIANISSLAG